MKAPDTPYGRSWNRPETIVLIAFREGEVVRVLRSTDLANLGLLQFKMKTSITFYKLDLRSALQTVDE